MDHKNVTEEHSDTLSTIHPLGALISLVVAGCLIVVLNGIALAVKMKKTRLSCNQYPYLWILLANIWIGIFSLPLYGLKMYGFESTGIKRVICSAWRYSYTTCTDMATFSVVVLAVGRVFTFAPFLKSLNNIQLRRLSLSLWFFVAVFGAVPFFLSNNEDKHEKKDCHFFVPKPWVLFRVTTLTITPYIFILGCYSYLTWILTKNAAKMEQYLKSVRRRKSEMKIYFELKITHEMLFVIAAFMICRLPSLIYHMLQWTCGEKCLLKNFKHRHKFLHFILDLLILLHAFFAPLIFVWRSSEFRKDAFKLFLGGPTSQTPSSNENIRSTEARPQSKEFGF